MSALRVKRASLPELERDVRGASRRGAHWWHPKRVVLVGLTIVVLVSCWSARAVADVTWKITSLSNTFAEPGGHVDYLLLVRNVGDETTNGTEHALTITLPRGLEGSGINTGFTSFGCSGVTGAAIIRCSNTDVMAPGNEELIMVTASVTPDVSRVRTARFEISGGGATEAASTVDPVTISAADAAFGIDAFDGVVSADAAGTPLTQASGHPYTVETAIDFNTHSDPSPVVGSLRTIEAVRDLVVDLPPGFVGYPSSASRCTSRELANTSNFNPRPLCAASSQVGTTVIRHSTGNAVLGPLPVFNMTPPPGVPARFGFNVLGTLVLLDVDVRTGSDYGLMVRVHNVSEGLAIVGTTISFWGVPAEASHDNERACPGQNPPATGGPTCASGAPRQAFFRNPTSCTAPGVGLPTTLRVTSWQDPGDIKEATFISHLTPGYPFASIDWGLPHGPDGCGNVPFDPTLNGQPVADFKAGAPAAFVFDLAMPQSSDPRGIGQADVKKAVVTLPEGVRVAAPSADGLQACASAQIALRSDTDPTCPDASRLGTVTIQTPLLDEEVKGAIYLAAPFDNPFKTLIALYLVARAQGVVVKLPGQATLDPATGQIKATFDDNPQLPFTNLHLEFKGGARAPLALPRRCGTYTTHAVLTGWNGRVVTSDSSFTLRKNARGEPCPSTFTPDFRVGTQSNQNGEPSSFVLRLTRDDEDQELKGVTVEMPDGLTGLTGNVPLCGETDAKVSTCPEASRVGTVAVGAGAGSSPFFITNGRVYLTGPYKGGPFGLAIVVPAVAGPFDLGTVAVRQAIYVDRHKATLRIVSDPLPTILEGIPLDVRDVRVNIDRKDFIVNPTSCAEKRIDGTLESVEGSIAHVSDRFQAADCASRSVDLRTPLDIGKLGRTGRGTSIPFKTTIRMAAASTHLRFVRVTLPTTLNARLGVINRACTRDAFENGRCEGARAGTVVVHTPLLRDPLRGNVYFVRNGNPLPDLFIALRGQVAFDLIGRVSIPGSKRLRTTFDAVPDVPFTDFTLKLVAGRQGPLGAATNLCSRRGRNAKAELDFIGQNGKVLQRDQRMRIHGCGGKRSARARRSAHKHGGR